MLKTIMTRSALIAFACSISLSAYAMANGTKRAIHIPSGDLAPALELLAKQSGSDLIYRPDQVQGFKTGGVNGELSTEEAVTQLLKGTPLILSTDSTGAMLIALPTASGANEAPQSSASTPERSESFWSRLRLAQSDTPATSQADTQNPSPSRGEGQGEDQNESQPQKRAETEEVVVTGSHIRGGGGASPVIVFDALKIAQSGAATLQQFFEKLPQNFASGANAGNVANSGLDRDVLVNDGRGSSINLRGLGTGTTLTLLNGRRITASNQFQYVDISLIPVSAVERVEVLTDGASAIYGADAIGGVVNIVLRKNFDGYETRLRYGSVTTGGLKEYQVSQTGGWTRDGGSALLSYEYLSQDNLKVTDKTFSRSAPFKPYDLYPQSERHSVYGFISQAITPDLTLDLNGIYAKRDVRATRGAAADFDVNVPTTEQYDVSAGLKYDLPASWQVRLNGAVGESYVVNTGTRTATTGAVTASSSSRISSNSRYVDLAADGPIYTLPAGDIRAALGATFREDEYRNKLTQRGIAQPVDRGARNVTSVFAEGVVPIVGQTNRSPVAERVEATVAVRFDDYSDFGSTVNPKVGLAWEAVPGLLFRGTYGTSFRAPVFQDLVERDAVVVVANLPNPASPTGRTLVMNVQGGNADLGPEEATTWTGGVELRPSFAPQFSIRLNYYNIEYTDRIDRGFPGNFTALFAQDTAPYASIITTNPSLDLINRFKAIGQAGAQYFLIPIGPFAVPAGQDERNVQVILDNRVRNNAATFQDGIDFDANYSFDVAGSRINLTSSGQYILSGTRKVTPTASEADVLNKSFLPVDFKFRAGASFSRGGWSATASLNYVGAYTDPLNTADPSVEAWKTVDMDVRYVAPASAPTYMRGASIALNVQNLLDKDPPYVVVSSGAGFDPVNANPLGRFVSLTVTKSW